MKTITEPEKLDLKSHDMADDKRAALLALFPEARTEGGKLDLDKLKLALGEAVDTGRERYGMNWPGKADCFAAVQAPSMATLRPATEESINFDSTQNLIIEGDNLQVLKLLQKGYQGKVKMIYIDPPYNTGKDFIYPDNYTEDLQTYLQYTGQVDAEGRKWGTNTDTDGRFHSKWLNMMYPRLALANNLLRQDGVIFISINDDEVVNLRRLCDELFGEENFIAQLVWEKGRKNDAKLFSVGHEYMLVYSRNLQHLKDLKTVWREEKPGAKEIWERYLELKAKYGKDFAAIEQHLTEWFSGLPEKHPSKKLSRYRRVDSNGPWRDRDISWPGGGGPRYDVPHPRTKEPCKVPPEGWRFAHREDMMIRIEAGVVEFREDHTEPPFLKAHLKPIALELVNEDDEDNEGESEEQGEDEGMATQVRGSYFYKQSQVAIKYLKQLLGPKVFNNPKDHVELARLMKYVGCVNEGDIVLDFFAGSGSTGDAVLELQKTEGAKTRFILVQLPEHIDPTNRKEKLAYDFCVKHKLPPTIASITKERVRRVIKKREAEQAGKLELEAKGDLGFRVYKLAESNFKPWNAEVRDATALGEQMQLHVHHVLEGRTEQDLFTEILMKSGFPLTTPVEHLTLEGLPVYEVNGGELMVCLAQPLTHEALKAMAMRKPQRAVCLDAGFADNDQLKANAVQLFKGKGVVFKTV